MVCQIGLRVSCIKFCSRIGCYCEFYLMLSTSSDTLIRNREEAFKKLALGLPAEVNKYKLCLQ